MRQFILQERHAVPGPVSISEVMRIAKAGMSRQQSDSFHAELRDTLDMVRDAGE